MYYICETFSFPGAIATSTIDTMRNETKRYETIRYDVSFGIAFVAIQSLSRGGL